MTLAASVAVSEPGPTSAELAEAKKAGKKMLRTAKALKSLIDTENKKLKILGVDGYDDYPNLVSELTDFVEAVEVSLRNPPSVQRKGSAMKEKTEFVVDLLAKRFESYGHGNRVTTTDDGVFVKTAELVLTTINKIAMQNGDEKSRVYGGSEGGAKNIVKTVVTVRQP